MKKLNFKGIATALAIASFILAYVVMNVNAGPKYPTCDRNPWCQDGPISGPISGTIRT